MAGWLDGFREGYEDFCDDLEDRGLPEPRVVLPVLAVLAVAVVGFLAFPFVAQLFAGASQKTVYLTVQDASGSAVKGAVVTVLDDKGNEVKKAAADDSGVVSFGLPPGSYQARVTADGFGEKVGSLSLEGENRITLASEQQLPKVTRVVAVVADKDGRGVSGATVVLSLPSGDRPSVTDSFGAAEFSLEQIPGSANLKASKAGFKDGVRQGVTQAELSSSASNPVQLVLEPLVEATPVPKAFVRVSIHDSAGKAVDGVTATLVDAATGGVVGASSAMAGVAVVDDVPPGKSVILRVSDPGQRFDEFVSPAFAADAAGKEVEVVLKRVVRDNPQALTVVVSGGGKPAAGADVLAFSMASGSPVAEGTADDAGSVQFVLPADTLYYVTAYADGFLPASADGAAVGGRVELQLEEATGDDSVRARVSVFEKGAPAPGARVAFYYEYGSKGRFLGVPFLTAGPSGVAEAVLPRSLGGQGYVAYAVADRDASVGGSKHIPVGGNGGQLEFGVDLVAPPAFVNATVVDSLTKRPLANAIVTAVFNSSEAASCLTDSAGGCHLTLESGVEFGLVAEAAGHAVYRALPKALAGGETSSVEFSLFPLSALSGVSVEFKGLFDAAGNKVLEPENAQDYVARFALSSQKADLAGMRLSLGGAGGSVVVSGIQTAAPLVVYGPDASTECGFVPVESGQDGALSARWAEVVFNTGFSGTSEVGFTLSFSQAAKAGDKLDLLYSAFGVAGKAPMLSPVDGAKAQELIDKAGSGRALSREDFCGAKSSVAGVKLSDSVLACTKEGVCTRLVFEDGAGRKGGANGFPVPVTSSLKLHFTVVSGKGVDFVGVSSQFFKVTSVESGGTVEQAPLRKAGFDSVSSTSSEEQVLAVSAAAGERVDGVVTLQAVRPGMRAPLDFRVHSPALDDAPTVVTRFLRVTGKNSFALSNVVPNSVSLGREEKVSIVLSNSMGVAVPDAIVTFFECGGAPLSGTDVQVVGDGTVGRGRQGKYEARITASAFGRIGVRAENADYDQLESCAIDVVGRDFLKVTPASLEFRGSSVPAQSSSLSLSSTLPADVGVTASVRCLNSTGGMASNVVSVDPRDFVLSGSQEVVAKLAEGASGRDNCVISFNAEAGPSVRDVQQVAVRLDVTAPPVQPRPQDLYVPISSSVTMRVDEGGSSQAFFYAGSLGEVTGCRVVPSGANPVPDGAIQVQCSAEVISISLQYDMADPAVCFPASGHTARIMVARRVAGLPQAEAAVGLNVVPNSPSLRPCAPPKPTPVPGASCAADADCPVDFKCDNHACVAAGCVAEGLSTPGTVSPESLQRLARACCPGLAELKWDSSLPGCSQPPEGGGNLCTAKCGNGVCGNGENACTCQADCGSVPNYPVLGDSINLTLNDLAFAEGYYRASGLGPVSGCEIRALEAGPAAVTNFLRVDNASCSSGVVHVVADYAGFPVPPGLYRNLVQSATLRLFRSSGAELDVPVTVSASGVSFAPENALSCGDGTCTADVENGTTCSADCPAIANCTNGVKDGSEQGIDCGGSCPANCTASSYPPLPSSISLRLRDDATATAAYSLSALAKSSSCTVVGCGIRPSFLDASNPATSMENYVTADQAACVQGVALIAADYSAYPGLYRSYVGSGNFFIECSDGRKINRPVRVSAETMGELPQTPPLCSDGVQNQGEAGVDCGGPCTPCSSSSQTQAGYLPSEVDLYLDYSLRAQREFQIPQNAQCGAVETSGGYGYTGGYGNGYGTGYGTSGSAYGSGSSTFNNQFPSSQSYGGSSSSGYGSSGSYGSSGGYGAGYGSGSDMRAFVAVDCSGGAFRIYADYSSMPPESMSRRFTQTGSVQVSLGSNANGSATGTVRRVRLVVSGATAMNQPYNPANPYGGAGGGGMQQPFPGTTPGTTPGTAPGTLPGAEMNQSAFAPSQPGASAGDKLCQFVAEKLGAAYTATTTPSTQQPATAQQAADPRAYWPGQQLSNSVIEVQYPSDYPQECRVPQVLYAPHLCAPCQAHVPGFDYFASEDDASAQPPAAQANQQAKQVLPQQQIATGAYPPLSGTSPAYNPFAPSGGVPGYTGSQQTYSPYNQQSQQSRQGQQPFASQSTASAFPQSQSASPQLQNLYSQLQYGQALPQVNSPALPASCQVPAVCTGASNCQLDYCKVISARPGSPLPLDQTPRVLSCSDKEITLGVNYPPGEASAEGMQVQSFNFPVTETTAKGKKVKHDLLVRVIAFSPPAEPPTPVPLWCGQSVSQQKAVIRVTEQNTNKYGLPSEITVKLNPRSLVGTYSWRVPVTQPDGGAIPFLCDAGKLESTLKGKPKVAADCTGDGKISLSLDYSDSPLVQDWNEAGFPQSISDAGTMRFNLEGIGGIEFLVPVKVVADEFQPLVVQLLVDSKTGEDTGEAYAASIPLSTRSLKLTGLKQAAEKKAKAVQEKLFVTAKYPLPVPALSNEKGTLKVSTRPERSIPVYAALVPHSITIRLDANGRVKDCGPEAASPAPTDGECAYAFFPGSPQEGLEVDCEVTGTSVATPPLQGQEGTLMKLSDKSCRGVFIKFDYTPIAKNDPQFAYFIEKKDLTLRVGDEMTGARLHVIPLTVLGAEADPDAKPDDKAKLFEAKLPLSPGKDDYDFNLRSTVVVSINTMDATKKTATAGGAEVKVGPKFALGVRFPQGDDAKKRSVEISKMKEDSYGEVEKVIYYWPADAAPIGCGEGCAPLSSRDAQGTANAVIFPVDGIGEEGNYEVSVSTVASGVRRELIIPLKTGLGEEDKGKAAETNPFTAVFPMKVNDFNYPGGGNDIKITLDTAVKDQNTVSGAATVDAGKILKLGVKFPKNDLPAKRKVVITYKDKETVKCPGATTCLDEYFLPQPWPEGEHIVAIYAEMPGKPTAVKAAKPGATLPDTTAKKIFLTITSQKPPAPTPAPGTAGAPGVPGAGGLPGGIPGTFPQPPGGGASNPPTTPGGGSAGGGGGGCSGTCFDSTKAACSVDVETQDLGKCDGGPTNVCCRGQVNNNPGIAHIWAVWGWTETGFRFQLYDVPASNDIPILRVRSGNTVYPNPPVYENGDSYHHLSEPGDKYLFLKGYAVQVKQADYTTDAQKAYYAINFPQGYPPLHVSEKSGGGSGTTTGGNAEGGGYVDPRLAFLRKECKTITKIAVQPQPLDVFIQKGMNACFLKEDNYYNIAVFVEVVEVNEHDNSAKVNVYYLPQGDLSWYSVGSPIRTIRKGENWGNGYKLGIPGLPEETYLQLKSIEGGVPHFAVWYPHP